MKTIISFSWCGNTITAAWSNVTAQGNTMVVIFRANNYINITTGRAQTGFRATIFFGLLNNQGLPKTILNLRCRIRISYTTAY